ncbi:MAG: hypothetical protein LEGION0398_MBIBDBAK_01236 [Legionellaceae bacterium]
MKFTKCNKNFISEIDLFLTDFDRQHPQPSSSQLSQIQLYQRIAQLRDKSKEKK